MNGQPITGGLPAAATVDIPADRLASLFDAHHERLYRLARRLVPTADDALDLVQETFLRAARSPESVPSGNTGEEAWLVRVLVNIRRDQWRKAGVRNRHDPHLALSGNSGETRGTHNPEAAMIARTMVWRALDLLPPRRRAIVVMHELEALSVPAIASLLGISAITVRWHLSMGRRDLARALMPYMGDSNENH